MRLFLEIGVACAPIGFDRFLSCFHLGHVNVLPNVSLKATLKRFCLKTRKESILSCKNNKAEIFYNFFLSHNFGLSGRL